MNTLKFKTEYENKYLDEFTEENVIGILIRVKFSNNEYYNGYIIGFMEDNIIVKFEKENEIWKINVNNGIYTLLLLDKKLVDINSNYMIAIKKKLKKNNVIKNINRFAIRSNKEHLSIHSNISKKKLGRKPDRSKWKNNYLDTKKLIESNSLKSNKYLNSWFYTQKNHLKNKYCLLRREKYQNKIKKLIQLYDNSKLKPKKLEINIPETSKLNQRTPQEIELDDLNEYTETMNSNYEVASQSPSSLYRSCNKDKINHHIRNLVNLHRDIDNMKEISDNPDIKKWISVIKAKTNI
tara:strand:+ start:105 stop:986 length:882 start_codon:yes stop_codon:yes gene_type:complete